MQGRYTDDVPKLFHWRQLPKPKAEKKSQDQFSSNQFYLSSVKVARKLGTYGGRGKVETEKRG